MLTWTQYAEEIARQLAGLSVRDAAGAELAPDAGYAAWERMTLAVKAGRHVVYLAGNGASASMASHMAADLAKNGRMHTQVLTDAPLLTAIGNDIDYESVFSFPLEIRANPGDMLVAISSSGGSPNLRKAIAVARRRRMAVVTVTSLRPDNPLRAAGDLNFYVPTGSYGHAESTHAAVLHHWMDAMERHRDEPVPEAESPSLDA